jgi:hypothetical protein
MSRSSASASSESDAVVGSDANASTSASESGSIVFTSAPKTEGTNSGDSCSWYSGGICSRPRSCADCLNVALSGQNVRHS